MNSYYFCLSELLHIDLFACSLFESHLAKPLFVDLFVAHAAN